MDRVKLGRALGYGTRHAARTVAAVVEAASAPPVPGSTATPAPSAASRPTVEAPAREPAGNGAARRSSVASARPVAAEVRRGAKSLWAPLAVYSGALWLRVTGLFFAVIATFLGAGAWRLRGTFRPGSPGVHHFWIFTAFAAAFAYFAISGFVRATLKERRGRVRPGV